MSVSSASPPSTRPSCGPVRVAAQRQTPLRKVLFSADTACFAKILSRAALLSFNSLDGVQEFSAGSDSQEKNGHLCIGTIHGLEVRANQMLVDR